MAIIIPTVIHAAGKAPSGDSSAGPAVVRFVAIAMFLAGAGMLIGMWGLQDRAQRSQTWPTTTGQVVEARAERQSGEDKKKYRAIIRYAYSVNGTAFESQRYSFGSSKRSKQAAEELCAKHPPGSAVTVHYDPVRPTEAVLLVQPSSGAIPLGIGGVLMMAAGGFVFTLSFRSFQTLATPSVATA